MFRVYYASAIDVCVPKAFEQIEQFRKIFVKYPKIKVFGAGFGESPIISPESTKEYKGIVTAYDLRQIRQCDMLLVVTDLETFCAGTMMEMEYARQQGLYIIILCLKSAETKVRNIFLETFAHQIVYSIKELEDILVGLI
jgi:nucleoside 2-deoxyribosyltransferase